MDANDAYNGIADKLHLDAGRFYGPSEGIALGSGLIYDRVTFPVYDAGTGLFDTKRGRVFVLSHECDVDPANKRPFNEDVLICPIIKFEDVFARLKTQHTDTYIAAFFANVVSRQMTRIIYMPPLPQAGIPLGGILFLNRITYTNVNAFEAAGAQVVGCLSAYGLRYVDYVLSDHLFREKSDLLALTRQRPSFQLQV